MMKLRLILPLFFLTVLLTVLARALFINPTHIPSPLIQKAAPSFTLPDLMSDRSITEKSFLGKITLVNVWASWCESCAEEHAFLLKLSQQKNLQIIGLDYKDHKADALKFLQTNKNPYRAVAFDEQGSTAIDWGVYGTPETFLIDKHGIILDKHIGPLTEDAWKKEFLPIIMQRQS